MTFSPTPKDLVSRRDLLLLSRRPIPSHRQKQTRVLVSVTGTPRLPTNHVSFSAIYCRSQLIRWQEAIWRTSSLYTFSPLSGLIISHEVESVRPLPGEGVAEWLKHRLLGWTGAKHDEEAIPCPRAVPVPTEAELVRFLKEKGRREGSE